MPSSTNISTNTNNGIVVGSNENGTINMLTQRESILRKLIDYIYTKIEDEAKENLSKYDTQEYTIEKKISHNCLDEEWEETIYELASYDNAINSALDDANDEQIAKKSAFLKSMQTYYKKALKELSIKKDDTESICAKSTEILECVTSYYTTLIKENNHDTKEFYDEDCVKILVAFGFAECKVLKKPTE